MAQRTKRRWCGLRIELLEAREVPTIGLDAGFGATTDGLLVNPFGNPGTFATSTNLVRQADGKFVVASSSDDYRVLVGRLNANGTPDTTFGQGGVYTIPSPNAHQVRAIAVQADGKLLLGGDGFSVPSGQRGFIIDRLTADGKPDPTFGNGGEVVVGFGGNDRLTGITVLPDGDIIAAGASHSVRDWNDTSLALARLNPDGSRDNGFDGDGKLLFKPGGVAALANAVTTQADGKIVVAGALPYFTGPSASGFAVFRFNGNGTPDTSFDGDGMTVPATGERTDADSVIVLGDGRVVAGGEAGGEALAWFAPNGTLTRFDRDPDANHSGPIQVLTNRANGGLVTAGRGGLNSPDVVRVIVSVYKPDGTLDTSFGQNGRISLGHSNGDDEFDAGGVAAEPSGAVVVAAGAILDRATPGQGNYSALALARLAEQGALKNAPVSLALQLPAAATAGQPTALAAVVRPDADAGVTPTGTVSFYDNGNLLGQATVGADGRAVFNTSALGVGPHTIVALYPGDAHYRDASFTSWPLTVARTATQTTLTGPANPLTLGERVTLTAQVSPPAGNVQTPTGTVTFFDGSTALATVTLSSGKATYSIGGLRLGLHSFKAVYSGDPNSLGSTGTLSVTVAKALIDTALTVSPGAVAGGEPVTLTAKVTARSPGVTPIGTVTFKDGSTVLGTAAVDGRGSARLTVSNLAAGAHALTAEYSGSSTCQASASAPVALTVGGSVQIDTSTSLTVTPISLVFSQGVALAATVTGPNGTPVTAGNLTFFDGTQAIGVVAINPTSKQAVLNVALNLGQHKLRAEFAGTGNALGSVSATQIVTVAKAPTTVSLFVGTPDGSAMRIGNPLALSVKVSPAYGGSPIGTVTFKDGDTVLGTVALNGRSEARLVLPLAAGTHHFTAVYSGSSTFLGSVSATFDLTAP